MPRLRRYPPEIREQAVRLVFEHEHEYPSRWAAIVSIRDEPSVRTEAAYHGQGAPVDEAGTQGTDSL